MESAAEFRARSFDGKWRRYQQRALDAFEGDRDRGDQHSYLVLPPGAGKTVIGLEAARRRGHRTLVLVPNHAVLGQWADTWDGRFPAVPGTQATPCGTDRDLAAPLNVLTYQSIAVIDHTIPAHQRREIEGGRDREALLSLLHPNGRAVIERAAATGPWTVVLDECHHLLDMWGALVRALIEELGAATTVIGLTATPARSLTRWQRELHDEIFGHRLRGADSSAGQGRQPRAVPRAGVFHRANPRGGQLAGLGKGAVR
ncbi:MAG: DEAD/DEAH box helicase family protein [Antricoccus sp.]